ncbi:MAG: diacylglycerol kinase family lipid kinase [Actinobacteria bacterium]|nr:diacylglycerol kinase family lipid kinase [Actinomycetota bacterium]
MIAHAGKSIEGGLPALRRRLAGEGVGDPLWYEIAKSRYAPAQARRALAEGAELVFVWGGDGTVQRCLDALAGSPARLAIVPAGSANLLASFLGVPKSIDRAVAIGLRGVCRTLDLGRFDKERFAVMAGVGFDAAMIRGADGRLKGRLGRVAYVWSGARSLREKPFRARIKVDGVVWFEGRASCILVGNVSELFGGIEIFEDARADDGRLEIGVVSAEGVLQWGRTLARTALSSAARSPFVQEAKACTIEVELGRRVRYELDGGDRKKVKSFTVDVEPAALSVCVPERETQD